MGTPPVPGSWEICWERTDAVKAAVTAMELLLKYMVLMCIPMLCAKG